MLLRSLLTLCASLLLLTGCGGNPFAPHHAVLDAPPLAELSLPALSNRGDYYPWCLSLQFSDDGSQLLFWTRSRMIHYALTEKEKGLDVRELSHIKLPPSQAVDGVHGGFAVSDAGLYPLYDAVELIPPGFERLKASVQSERRIFEENKAFADGSQRFHEPNFIGSFINGEQEMLLCGRELGFEPVAVCEGKVRQEFSDISKVMACASISLDKQQFIALRDDHGRKTEFFVFFRKGRPYWEICKADHTDGDTGVGSLHAYSAISSTGKFALLRFVIASYDRSRYTPVKGTKGGFGHVYDKYIYLLVDVANKKILQQIDRLEHAGDGIYTPIVTIDERSRRLAVFNEVAGTIVIQSF